MAVNVLEFLEASARDNKDKTACADVNESYSYGMLLDYAKRTGSALIEKTEAGMPVPVVMDKSCRTLAIFMGIVYAGCFYVMLDASQPAARLESILNTLDAKLIVTDSESASAVNGVNGFSFPGMILNAEELMTHDINEDALAMVRRQALDIDPLYSIFTSGSTGVPKGVIVSHRSVIDFIQYFTELFHITGEDIIGNQAPFDFDVSVKDIYSCLYKGATLQLIPKKYFSFPAALLDYLDERKVTTLIWAVSALCIVTTLDGFKYRRPGYINKVIFSGEVMPVKHLNAWREQYPDAMFVNVYGPTEITCNCTYYIVDREFGLDETLPIGRPFPNEKVFLLDDEDRLITAGMEGKQGEVCVSGTALSLGYYRNQDRTSSAFVQNPLNDRYIEIIYRTGDIGYYNKYGEMCFSSRKDFQIKHMGHRIELGEIEAAMGAVDDVIRSCCIFDSDKNKIIGFYQGSIEVKELVRALGRRLPSYMIPNVFYRTESMPVTKNGKIDRARLMEDYKSGQ